MNLIRPRGPYPKKRLGQHFLHDPTVIERIVESIAPARGQRIVEIGPGRGALTLPLLRELGKLDAVEYDGDLLDDLRQRCGALGELTLHHADALSFAFRTLATQPERLRIVGNLPYNISTPLLFHLLAQTDCIEDLVFMVQKEVAERITAPPASEPYGRLSVMVQYRCAVQMLFRVPPGAFSPPPKVNSAVIRLVPEQPELAAVDERLFSEIVRMAFSHRRKTLRNALRGLIEPTLFVQAGVNDELRAEVLTVRQFVEIANLRAGCPS